MASTPNFPGTPDVTWINGITAANTAKDGTGTLGTDIFEVFVAHATNGSHVQKLIARPRGTNVATVLRLFVNNGSSNGTAANNALINELTLPATTNSETASLAAPELILNLSLQPGHRLLATIGTAVAGGYAVSVWGGDY
jgi:hypothetical protein